MRDLQEIDIPFGNWRLKRQKCTQQKEAFDADVDRLKDKKK